MSFLDRIARVDLGKKIYPWLPPKMLDALPETSLRGRANADGGKIRSWGLEHGSLRQTVSRDPLYRKALAASGDRSLVSSLRLSNLFILIRFYFESLATSNIAELGVYRGGNILFMATLLAELYPGARVFAFDTFEGMPETNRDYDLHIAGDFADASLEDVQRAVRSRGLTNVEFVKGDVRQTLAGFNVPLALTHIDLDIYEPIRFAQEEMWKLLVDGGYLVYDDATTGSCGGATRAVEEFIISNRVHSEQIFPHFVFRKA